MCLLWGFRHPDHEQRAAALVERAHPGAHVSTSHETAGVFREYERCATTVVDAALSPLLRGYLERLVERCGQAGLPEPEVMLSSGGAADAATAARHAAWTVLSGPAGGAVGAARAAAGAGLGDAVGLDMGGTSCDVSLALGGGAAVGTGAIGRAAARWRCRWSTCTRSARAAGRSPGATPAAPSASARARREPNPAPRATDAAASCRRSRTPTCCWAASTTGSPLAGGVSLDRAAAERAVAALGAELGPGR